MPAAEPSQYRLLPHPSAPAPGVEQLSVAVSREAGGVLRLHYRLSGELSSLVIPDAQPPQRTDGLWRRTCFEAFVGAAGAEYREFNFSPSGSWAAYRFSAYRTGMLPLAAVAAPVMSRKSAARCFELEVMLDAAWLASLQSPAALRLGLAAVIEDRAGVLSYWALKHPVEKPDFHHADSLVVALA